MNDQDGARVHRRHREYLAPVAVAVGGAVAFFGPWTGYWEQAGLFLLVLGVALWAIWEVFFYVR